MRFWVKHSEHVYCLCCSSPLYAIASFGRIPIGPVIRWTEDTINYGKLDTFLQVYSTSGLGVSGNPVPDFIWIPELR